MPTIYISSFWESKSRFMGSQAHKP